MVQSIARENSILLNARASLCPKGSSFIFSDRIFHSSRGYTKRQVSRPKVIINFSPKDSRYFAGTISLPFSSIVCSYCPKNIKSPLYYILHFTPFYSTKYSILHFFKKPSFFLKIILFFLNKL